MVAIGEVTLWELYGKEPVERLELGVSIGAIPEQQELIDLAITAFERATATYAVTGMPLGAMNPSGFLLYLNSSVDDIDVNEHVRITSRPLTVIGTRTAHDQDVTDKG